MRVTRFFCLAAIVLSLVFAIPGFAQSTISTGSIQGTITDPHDAVVSGANITITNKETGQAVRVTSSSSGTFSSGALSPGTYSRTNYSFTRTQNG